MLSLLFASPRRISFASTHLIKRRASSRFAPCTVLLAALFFACVSVPARADTPDEQWTFATGLYSKKLWGLAAQELDKFVKSFPSHPKAKFAAYQLGGALYRATNDKGEVDYAAAAAAFGRAITRYPDPKLSAAARFELGDALFNLKKYNDAIAAQTAFLASKPVAAQAAQAQYWIGESWYALKKTASARTAYQAVVAKYPTSDVAPYASYSLGLLAADEGRFSEAATAFKTVIAKFPASDVAPESRLRLGDALLSAGQFVPAQAAYRATIGDAHATEWKTDALLGIADAQFGAKAWGDAASSYQTAIAALKADDARRSPAQLSLGDSYFNAKKYEEALAAYAPLQSGDAKIAPAALYFSGGSLRALKRYDEAARAYRGVMERFAKTEFAPRAALRLGDTLADAGDTKGAIKAYGDARTKYAKTNPTIAKEAQQAVLALAADVIASSNSTATNGGTATNGTTKTASSNNSDTLEQVLRALPSGPETSNVQLQLAQAAFGREEWDRAATLAQSALTGKPDAATSENALYLVASSRLRAGQTANATTAFQKQLALHPKGALAAQGRLGLAWSLLDAKKWDAAASVARAAASVARSASAASGAPTDTIDAARLALGEALMRGGKPKEAVDAFSLAQKSKDKETATQGALGAALSLEAQKQWSAAATRWNQLAALSSDAPSRSRAFLRQGIALAKTANGATNTNGTLAMAAFDRALVADPKGETAAQSLYESAWLAHDLKRAPDEAARWARLSHDFPDSPQALEADFQVGEALFAARKWDEAAVAYRRVVEREKTPATTGATANASANDVTPFAWYKLGSALYQAKKWGEAAPAFERAATAKSDVAAESSFWAGESRRRAGDNALARALYETFVKIATRPSRTAPPSLTALLPAARLGMGQVLMAQNDAAGAIAAYRAGLGGASGNVAAELNFRLGEALEKTNQPKEAEKQYLKVVITYEKSEWASQAKERLQALGVALPKS